ncbi:hypothetical protein JTB14_033097 [Gonioctena quinquepunctata]|nr:hypothetical protein JTB14_033097 [Gonioctena quinquepunctata]
MSHLGAEKLGDKDKGSKSNTNCDVNTPPPLSAGNKTDNSAGNALSAFSKNEIEDMDFRMMLLATREVKFSAIIGDEITSPLYTLMEESIRKTNPKAYDAIFKEEFIYKKRMELPSDLDTHSQGESFSGEESISEGTWEVESTTEQQDVMERKKDNDVEEPENRPNEETSPLLEQHENEYFVHLSNAESDDKLDNQQKSEQFMNR